MERWKTSGALAFLALAAALGSGGCQREPEGPCERYCTVTLDHCGPGSTEDVERCTGDCIAEWETKSGECDASFEAYADCAWDDGDCDFPQCDDEFGAWSDLCYASGDLDGPFALTAEVDADQIGAWTGGELVCSYPIVLLAEQGGIGRWQGIYQSSTIQDPAQFCRAEGWYDAGITELLGSQLIRAGVPQTLAAEVACDGAFVSDWQFSYLDPDGAERFLQILVACVEP